MKTIREAIEESQAPHSEQKARWNALKQVKWHLRAASGEYVAKRQPAGVSMSIATTTAKSDAQTFDGRDNEEMKARHFSARAGITFQAVLA